MGRFLVTFLVVLALVGVATGGILRPCNCAHEGCTCRALAARAGARTPTRGCCGACPPKTTSSRHDENGAPHRCPICHKPPPPTQEAEPAVRLDPPAKLAFVGPQGAHAPVHGAAEASRVPADLLALPPPGLPPPWRLAPSGLSIFLL